MCKLSSSTTAHTLQSPYISNTVSQSFERRALLSLILKGWLTRTCGQLQLGGCNVFQRAVCAWSEGWILTPNPHCFLANSTRNSQALVSISWSQHFSDNVTFHSKRSPTCQPPIECTTLNPSTSPSHPIYPSYSIHNFAKLLLASFGTLSATYHHHQHHP